MPRLFCVSAQSSGKASRVQMVSAASNAAMAPSISTGCVLRDRIARLASRSSRARFSCFTACSPSLVRSQKSTAELLPPDVPRAANVVSVSLISTSRTRHALHAWCAKPAECLRPSRHDVIPFGPQRMLDPGSYRCSSRHGPKLSPPYSGPRKSPTAAGIRATGLGVRCRNVTPNCSPNLMPPLIPDR
jgi:hypothetical protein